MLKIILVLIFYYIPVKAIEVSNSLETLQIENVHEKIMSSLKAIVTEGKISPVNGTENDEFGFSVSISGDRALVGSYLDDGNGIDSGAAYIYTFENGLWSQTVKLTASDGAANDNFGISVSLSGNIALIGANLDDDNAWNSGSAYIYKYDGSKWVENEKLTASDAGSNNQFGYAVSLSGNQALIGAKFDDDNGALSGSAYIFDLNGNNWIQSAKLKPQDGQALDYFGFSVSLSGNRALVGAYLDDDNGNNSGSAYIFNNNGGIWSETTKLVANDAGVSDYFGYSVSLSNESALIGAKFESNQGAAYMFGFDGIGWSQTAKIMAADGVGGDQFGNAVSLEGNLALIGTFSDDDNGINSGSAYLYEYTSGGIWMQLDKFTAVDGVANDEYGHSVSLSSQRVIIGARFNDEIATNAGAAYIINISPTYKVSGTVSGLAPGNILELQNNLIDNLVINSNGTFTFGIDINDGMTYDVIVNTQPTTPNQNCVVTNGSGSSPALNVYDVQVICITNQYLIGGSVSGLEINNSVSLSINQGTETLILNSNGGFVSANGLDDESNYIVSVLTNPVNPNQSCNINNNSGILNGADITNIHVNCITNQYFIGGSVSGLEINNSVSLSINQGNETLILNSNGGFVSANGLDDESNYIVSVLTNPVNPNQSCDIKNDSGILNGDDITNIYVNCITNSYFVGGITTGLYSGNFMLLQNNGSDDLAINFDGAFVFNTPVIDHQSYNISIKNQPINPIQLCTVNNGNSAIAGNDVTTVNINCNTGTDLIYRNNFEN